MTKKPRNLKHLELGARIRAAREAKGWKLRDLTEATGGALAENRISNYENGIRGPDASVCKVLAQVLGVNFDWLLFGEGPREAVKSQENYSPFGIAERATEYALPILGAEGAFMPDSSETRSLAFAIISHGPRAFVFQVADDAMLPEYRLGDYVIADPDVAPILGDDVVAASPEQVLSLRRVEKNGEGDCLAFLNPAHPERVPLHAEGWAIQGTVLFLVRRRLAR
jgi:transcriptional regulator with XRE-family HTH domain